MKTTAQVRLQKKQEGKDTLQFLAAKMDQWDVTNIVVDKSKLNVEELEEAVRAGEQVVVEVDISDKAVEDAISKLLGYAKSNYVQAAYGIPESFRFP